MNYSNPRMEATIENWPSGSYRTTAIFKVEQHKTRGERATRVTLNPKTGEPSAVKVLTYAGKVRIVDGDDGRTYILEMSNHFNHIIVRKGDMKYQHEYISYDNPKYTKIRELFVDNCPICGEKVNIIGDTADGRLIGSCKDAFHYNKWIQPS